MSELSLTVKNPKKRKSSFNSDCNADRQESSAEDGQHCRNRSVAGQPNTTPETPCPSSRRNARRPNLQGKSSSARSDKALGNVGETFGEPLSSTPRITLEKEEVDGRSSSPSPCPYDLYSGSEDVSDAISQTPSPGLDGEANEFQQSIVFKKTNADLSRRAITTEVFGAMLKGASTWKESKPGEDGRIYVLVESNNTEYVKIGRTTKSPEQRKKQVQRCGKIVFELVNDQDHTKVTNHERLEAIIHADLWNERHYFYCRCRKKDTKSEASSHCLDTFTKHGEWFKMSKADAMQRVELWREWMRREPYDAYGVLKPEWQRRISRCEKNKSFKDILDPDFMGSFPGFPSWTWLRSVTIEPRYNDQNFPGPSRVDAISDNKKEVVCFLVFQLLLSLLLLDLMTFLFPLVFQDLLSRACVYLFLASTSVCWL